MATTGSRGLIKSIRRGFTIITLLLLTSSTRASSSDAKQPVLLDSDSAACKHQKNSDVCTYSGNAKFNQGTTHLQAQQISIHKTGSKLNKIVASGKHSSYSTIDDNRQQINASADLITIDYDKNAMLLEHDGQLIVGKDKLRAPYIAYKFE